MNLEGGGKTKWKGKEFFKNWNIHLFLIGIFKTWFQNICLRPIKDLLKNKVTEKAIFFFKGHKVWNNPWYKSTGLPIVFGILKVPSRRVMCWVSPSLDLVAYSYWYIIVILFWKSWWTVATGSHKEFSNPVRDIHLWTNPESHCWCSFIQIVLFVFKWGSSLNHC